MLQGDSVNLPGLAVARPITTLVLLVSILVVGGIAVTRLPLAFLPEVDAPFIGIEIPYPNSNPTQVEREIVKPVEEALSTLSGVKQLSSTATADSAEFQMEFNWGQELDIVRMQVSEKMEQVRPLLPESVGEVLIFSFNTSDIPVVESRISAEGVDLSTNYDLLEARVMNRLRRVPGVARVELDGVAPREINIDLILDRVKAHAVDIGALVERLRTASGNVVLGRVDQGGLRYTARAVGELPLGRGDRRAAGRHPRPAAQGHRRRSPTRSRRSATAATSTTSRRWRSTSTRSRPPTASRWPPRRCA